MAAIVVGATLVLLLALSSGPWGHAVIVDDAPGQRDVHDVDEDRRLDISLYPTGEVQVDPGGDRDLTARYDALPNAPRRAALESEVAGSLRDLVQVVAVMVLLIAVVGTMRPLTPHTWALVAAAALIGLVATVILRGDVTSALGSHVALMDLGAYDTGPTGWSAVAVGAAGAAGLTAALAAGPRPERAAETLAAARRRRAMRVASSTPTVTGPVSSGPAGAGSGARPTREREPALRDRDPTPIPREREPAGDRDPTLGGREPPLRDRDPTPVPGEREPARASGSSGDVAAEAGTDAEADDLHEPRHRRRDPQLPGFQPGTETRY